MATEAVDLVVDAARERDARLIGITGAIAAGKSTLAAAVAQSLDAAVVSTDGFLLSNAALAEAGLTDRKGFPESFDHAALAAFVDEWKATGRASAPRYSHLHYDVVGVAEVDAWSLVVEGLHLSHPSFGVRDRLDLLVHLDASDDCLARWYLERFQELRTAAATDPTAFLYPYREMPGDALDAIAMDVWRSLNMVVVDEQIRPHEALADLVITLDADHQVSTIER